MDASSTRSPSREPAGTTARRSISGRPPRRSQVNITMTSKNAQYDEVATLSLEIRDPETVLSQVLEKLTQKFPPESVLTICGGTQDKLGSSSPSTASSNSGTSTAEIIEIPGILVTPKDPVMGGPWIKLSDGSIVGHIDPRGKVHILAIGSGPASMPRVVKGGVRTTLLGVLAVPKFPGATYLTDENGKLIGEIDEAGHTHFHGPKVCDRSQGPCSQGPCYGQPWNLKNCGPGAIAGTVAVVAEGCPYVREWLVDPKGGAIRGHTEQDGKIISYPTFPPSPLGGLRLQGPDAAGNAYLTTPCGIVVGHVDRHGVPVIHPNCPGAARPGAATLPPGIRIGPNAANPNQPFLVDEAGRNVGYLTAGGHIKLTPICSPVTMRSAEPGPWPDTRRVPRDPLKPLEGYWVTTPAGRVIGHIDKDDRPVRHPSRNEVPKVDVPEGQVRVIYTKAEDDAELLWLTDDRGEVVGHYDASGKLVLHPANISPPDNAGSGISQGSSHRRLHGNHLVPKNPAKPDGDQWVVGPSGLTIGQMERDGRIILYPRLPARPRDPITGKLVGSRSGVPGMRYHPLDRKRPEIGGPWISDDSGHVMGHYGPDGRPVLHPQFTHGGPSLGRQGSIAGTVLVPQNPNKRDLGSWIIDAAGRCVGHTTPDRKAILYPQLSARPVDPATGRPTGPNMGVPGVNFVPRDPGRPDIGGPWLVDDEGIVVGHYGPDGKPVLHPQFKHSVDASNLPSVKQSPVEIRWNASRIQDGSWLVDIADGRVVGHTTPTGDQTLYPTNLSVPARGPSHPNLPNLHFVPRDPNQSAAGGPWLIDNDGRVVGAFGPDGVAQIFPRFPKGTQPQPPSLLSQCPPGPLASTVIVRSEISGHAWLAYPEDGVVCGHLDEQGRPVVYPQLRNRMQQATRVVPGIFFVALDPEQPELGGPWLVDDGGNVIGHFGADGQPVWVPQFPTADGRWRPQRAFDNYAVLKTEGRPEQGCWIVDRISRLPIGDILASGRSHMFPKFPEHPQGKSGPVFGTVLVAKDQYRPMDGSWLIDSEGRVVGEVDEQDARVISTIPPNRLLAPDLPLVPLSTPSSKPILAVLKDADLPDCGAWIVDPGQSRPIGEISRNGYVHKFPHISPSTRPKGPPGPLVGNVLVPKALFAQERGQWIIDSYGAVVGEVDEVGAAVQTRIPPNGQIPPNARLVPVVPVPEGGARPAVTVPKNPGAPSLGVWVIDSQTCLPVGEVDARGECHMFPGPNQRPHGIAGPIPGTIQVAKDFGCVAKGFWLLDASDSVVGELDSESHPVTSTYGPDSAIPWFQLPPPTTPLLPVNAHMPVVLKYLGQPDKGRWILDSRTRKPIGEIDPSGAVHMFPKYELDRRPSGPPAPIPGAVLVLKDPFTSQAGCWIVDELGNVVGETDKQGAVIRAELSVGVAVSSRIQVDLFTVPHFPGVAPQIVGPPATGPAAPHEPAPSPILKPETPSSSDSRNPTLAVGRPMSRPLPPLDQLALVPVHGVPGGILYGPTGRPVALFTADKRLEVFSIYPANTQPDAAVPGPLPVTWAVPKDHLDSSKGWYVVQQSTGEVIGEMSHVGVYLPFPTFSGNVPQEFDRPWAAQASPQVPLLPIHPPATHQARLDRLVYVSRVDDPARQWLVDRAGGQPLGEVRNDKTPVLFPGGVRPHAPLDLPQFGPMPSGLGFYDMSTDPGPVASSHDSSSSSSTSTSSSSSSSSAPLGARLLPDARLPPDVSRDEIMVTGQRHQPGGHWLVRPGGRPIGRVSPNGVPEIFPHFPGPLSAFRSGPLGDIYLVPKQTEVFDEWIVNCRGEVVGEHNARDVQYVLFPTQKVNLATSFRPWRDASAEIPPQDKEITTVIEVEVIQEVIVNKPVRQVVEVERKVTVPQVVEVEKIVEVPEVRYVERKIDGPDQIVWQERIQHVPQIIERPREEVKYVQVPQVVVREVIVEKPIPAPRPVRVETPIEVIVPRIIDREVPTVVAQQINPNFRATAEPAEFDMKQYEPVLIPTEIFVPVPVKMPTLAKEVSTHHRCVNVPAPHWNSLVKAANEGLLARNAQNDRYLPWLQETRTMMIPTLPARERIDLIPPTSSEWKSTHAAGQIHVEATAEYTMKALQSIVNEIVETQKAAVQNRRAEVERQLQVDSLPGGVSSSIPGSSVSTRSVSTSVDQNYPMGPTLNSTSLSLPAANQSVQPGPAASTAAPLSSTAAPLSSTAAPLSLPLWPPAGGPNSSVQNTVIPLPLPTNSNPIPSWVGLAKDPSRG